MYKPFLGSPLPRIDASAEQRQWHSWGFFLCISPYTVFRTCVWFTVLSCMDFSVWVGTSASMYVSCAFSSAIFPLFILSYSGLFISIIFYFTFFFRRKRECGLGWERKWEDLGGDCGEETVIRIFCKKKINVQCKKKNNNKNNKERTHKKSNGQRV